MWSSSNQMDDLCHTCLGSAVMGRLTVRWSNIKLADDDWRSWTTLLVLFCLYTETAPVLLSEMNQSSWLQGTLMKIDLPHSNHLEFDPMCHMTSSSHPASPLHSLLQCHTHPQISTQNQAPGFGPQGTFGFQTRPTLTFKESKEGTL